MVAAIKQKGLLKKKIIQGFTPSPNLLSHNYYEL